MNKEQLTATEATLSCTVAGLADAFIYSDVKWTTSGDVDVTTLNQGYIVDVGSLVGPSKTTTLTIPADKNNNDATYSCIFTSHGLNAQISGKYSKLE